VRAFVLPLLAVVLVAIVLGVQVQAGGGDYVPRRLADPCDARAIPPIPPRLEPLTERIVLLGLDRAACRLGVPRERLVLSLADRRALDPDVAPALKAGLRDAVDRLERERRLPKASQLLPEVLDQADLPGLVKTIIAQIPDRTVDNALPTGPVLRRAVDELDVARLLHELDDPDRLESAIQSAVLRAVRDELVERLRPG
jgi:hypothetical protein